MAFAEAAALKSPQMRENPTFNSRIRGGSRGQSRLLRPAIPAHAGRDGKEALASKPVSVF